jgi:hypothetical protein
MPRNIVLAVSLPAPPDRLYDMYLDPTLHAPSPTVAPNGHDWVAIILEKLEIERKDASGTTE